MTSQLGRTSASVVAHRNSLRGGARHSQAGGCALTPSRVVRRARLGTGIAQLARPPWHTEMSAMSLAEVTGVGVVVSGIVEELEPRGVRFVGVTDRPVPEGRLPRSVPIVTAGAAGGRIRWEAGALPRAIRRRCPSPPGSLPCDLEPRRAPRASLPFGPHGARRDSRRLLPDLVPWPRPALLHRWLYRRALASARRGRRDSGARRSGLERILPATRGRSRSSRTRSRAGTRRSTRSRPEPRAWNGGRPYWLYVGGFDPRKGSRPCSKPWRSPSRSSRAPVLDGGMNGGLARAEASTGCEQLPGLRGRPGLPSLSRGHGLPVPSRYEGFDCRSSWRCRAVRWRGRGFATRGLGDAGLFFRGRRRGARAGPAARRHPEERAQVAERGRASPGSADAAAERMLRVYDRALGRRTGSS